MAITPGEKLADKLFDEFWAGGERTLPDVVYHYTTAAGLSGVLKSKRVWATDCRFLNDETESQLAVIIAREAVRKRSFVESDTQLRQYYRRLSQRLRADPSERNFVFSLSERADDLSQWRAYANEGRGFTIGFKTETLLKHGNASTCEYGFSKVTYSSSLQQRKVREAIAAFEKLFDENPKIGEDVDEFSSDLAKWAEWIISAYSVLFKHSSFRAEREWRINTYSDKDLLIECRGDRLVPYTPLKLCKEEENCLPIQRIGVGPGFKDSAVTFAVDKLCKQNGFEVEIYSADTPFRRL